MKLLIVATATVSRFMKLHPKIIPTYRNNLPATLKFPLLHRKTNHQATYCPTYWRIVGACGLMVSDDEYSSAKHLIRKGE